MLQVQNIEKYYGSKSNVTKALDRVSFDGPYSASFAGKVRVAVVPRPSTEEISSPSSRKPASLLHRYRRGPGLLRLYR